MHYLCRSISAASDPNEVCAPRLTLSFFNDPKIQAASLTDSQLNRAKTVYLTRLLLDQGEMDSFAKQTMSPEHVGIWSNSQTNTFRTPIELESIQALTDRAGASLLKEEEIWVGRQMSLYALSMLFTRKLRTTTGMFSCPLSGNSELLAFSGEIAFAQHLDKIFAAEIMGS